MLFLSGKRSCLGEPLARQEIFLFLAGIVQNFDIRPLVGQSEIAYGVENNISVHPTPFQVQLVPRKNKTE